MKLYLAGAFFTEGQRSFLEKIDSYLRSYSVTTFLPHRDLDFSSDSELLYHHTLEALHRSDALIITFHGPEIDSTTAWLVGYAHSRNVPVLGLSDDIRFQDESLLLPPHLSHSVAIVHSLDHLRDRLISLITQRQSIENSR